MLVDQNARKKPIIVCDFDGTVTTRDLGGALARHYSSDQDKMLHRQFTKGEITLFELQSQIWPRLKISQGEIEKFMDAHAVIRDGFRELLYHCAARGIDFYIVSGGFDFYIPYLLKRQNLNLPDPTKLFTNRGIPTESGLQVSFPYRDPVCDYCSNCKGHFVRKLRGQSQDSFVIGIGDGESDLCMAQEVDQLFACSNLLQHCEEQGIPHTPFGTFYEIIKIIE